MDTNEIQGAARDVQGKIKDGYGGLTGDTGTQIDGKIDQAAGKIQGRYGEAIDKVTSAASTAAESASATVSELRRTLNDTVKSVRSEARHAGEVVNETVHESPWLSIIGVAAIGYLASFLIHSPSSPLAPRAPAPRYVTKRLARYM
jgi:uncharacterized protein YjbJ (UPF0337 family)